MSHQPTIAELISINEKLKKQHEEDMLTITKLTAQMGHLQKMLFAPKTEKKKVLYPDDADSPEISLFNEAEVESDIPLEKDSTQEKTTEVKAHRRKKRTAKSREEILGNLPHKKVIHDLTEEEKICQACGHPLVPMGEKLIRIEVIYHPATIEIIDHMVKTYECRECRKDDKPYIVMPKVDNPVIPHSYASSSAVAHAIVQKYIYAMPLYRQEKEWANYNVPIPRTTLANWVILATDAWLMPIAELMHRELLLQPSIHIDETPVQVHKVKGKANHSKSYMWVYTSGKYEKERRIILFDYQPGRSGDNARKYLEGYNGYFHTDDFSGYGKLDPNRHCLCWAHARRQFVNCKVPGISSYEGTLVQEGINRIAAIYKTDNLLNDLPPETRKLMRQGKEKEQVEEFFAWAKKVFPTVLPKSGIGRALLYSISNEQNLKRYLTDGICEIDNNPAENSIRPFTIGRKNWLFCDTPKGARASAAAYSILETCVANGIDPEKYLNYVFTRLPNEEWPQRETTLEKYLPWSPEIQKECK